MDTRRVDGSGFVGSATLETPGPEVVKEAKKGIAEGARDVFEAPVKKSLDQYVSDQGEARTAKGKAFQEMNKTGPEEARTAKGKAYQEMLKKDALEPGVGEARTAKGKAYLELVKRGDIQTDSDPGEARTAKGKAYQELVKRGDIKTESDPGEARTAKGKAYQQMLKQQE